ncbi:MAG TPA: hypothetical protein VF735_21925 [Pyrinomonadaceae bacterium]|jgi:hypothetical protein
MLQIRKDYLVFKLPGFALMAFALACFVTGTSVSADAQTRTTRGAATSAVEPQPKGEDEPLFSEYKGVRIGMLADEARKKLGSPQDKSDEQDFFVFNERESAQVFYDKSRKTYAISINYLGTNNNNTPQAKTVFGTDIEAKPDGSMFKMVRYPKAGYWVSYSRTSGSDPIVSITIQRID